MSIVGDFDLNSHASSLKDVIKQTMLTQEVIFRKQVRRRFLRMLAVVLIQFGELSRISVSLVGKFHLLEIV